MRGRSSLIQAMLQTRSVGSGSVGGRAGARALVAVGKAGDPASSCEPGIRGRTSSSDELAAVAKEMRLLELFRGTGSIGRAFDAQGWEVVSLDILPGATITCNILEWDYKKYPSGHFDFIWASPPCTEYSIARSHVKTPRDFDGADAIVRKTLEIIEFFSPPLWLLENPQTGYLKTRGILDAVPWRDVTYCKYGFPYKKKTRLWGCFPFEFRPPCKHNDECEHVVNGKHAARVQDFYKLRDRYKIPPPLCDYIACMSDVWCKWTPSSLPS